METGGPPLSGLEPMISSMILPTPSTTPPTVLPTPSTTPPTVLPTPSTTPPTVLPTPSTTPPTVLPTPSTIPPTIPFGALLASSSLSRSPGRGSSLCVEETADSTICPVLSAEVSTVCTEADVADSTMPGAALMAPVGFCPDGSFSSRERKEPGPFLTTPASSGTAAVVCRTLFTKFTVIIFV
ncbi:hypothetical protein DQG23_17230 [Paenibacillus contaminans]|uniref:Uncharacterized protein n=1 Tax=Paenibacillus contaminans TaxID=450362 RepID=A0A329MK57_9BACL|nr:hypothetical protein DQG23_17230 [Paenibacillus contaminans]